MFDKIVGSRNDQYKCMQIQTRSLKLSLQHAKTLHSKFVLLLCKDSFLVLYYQSVTNAYVVVYGNKVYFIVNFPSGIQAADTLKLGASEKWRSYGQCMNWDQRIKKEIAQSSNFVTDQLNDVENTYDYHILMVISEALWTLTAGNMYKYR